jgi:hypothetical protein
MLNRRAFVVRVTGLMAGGLAGQQLFAQSLLLRPSGTPITIYKSSSCGCCAKWVDYMGANGFAPMVHDEENMDTIKDELGVPDALRSCHTALVEKYLIEGHVPAADIRRLLAEKVKVSGLAVPGMPGSTPGMALPGTRIAGFEVVAFQSNGTTSTFARY